MTKTNLIAIMVAALAASNQYVRADLMVGFTLLNDSGTIYPTGPYGLTDPLSVIPASACEIAVPFVMTAGGQLHSVDFPIARRSLSASCTTPRTISLSADAGGQPGTVLEAWSIVPTLTPTLVGLASVKHPELTAGAKYWLTGHINPTGTACDYWYANGLGTKGTRLWRKSPTASWSTYVGGLLPAFRVTVADNQPPVARIVASATKGAAPLAVKFSGANSTDADGTIASYAWSFGDGGTSSAVAPSHTYSGVGTYTVKLTVTDDYGATAAASVAISVAAPNQPPVARIVASATKGAAPLAVEFSGANSTDAEGSIASYAWAFGDGGTSSAVAPSHTFSAAGTYTVTLKVTDKGGATAQASVVITVDLPSLPLAVGFTTMDQAATINTSSLWGISDPGPTGFNAGCAVVVPFVIAAGGPLLSVDLAIARRALAGSSTTPRVISLAADDRGRPGAVLESWSIVPQLTASLVGLASVKRPNLTAGATYWLSALINPTGTACDGWYGNHNATLPAFRVNVGVAPVNQPPLASIAASATTGSAPLTVAFSGEDSTDADGTIVAYAWSFGDGGVSDAMAPNHTFGDAGTYTVTLTVTDGGGATAQATAVVVVAEPTVGFTLLDAAGTIYTTGPYGLTDPLSPIPASACEIAVPFVLTDGGLLHSVDFPIARRSFGSLTDPRTISLSTDAGGQPGDVLEAWSIIPGLTPTLVELTSMNLPELKAGTQYWLTGHIDPAGAACDFWYANGLALTGPRLWRKSPTVSWTTGSGSLPAFRVKVGSMSMTASNLAPLN